MAASTLSTNLIGQNLAIATDIRGTTSANSAVAFSTSGYLDMKNYEGILVQYTRAVGTGTLTAFRLDVSANSDGSSGTTLKSHALGTAVDAVGDSVFIEVDAKEIPQVLAAGRYVSAVVVHPTATEKGAITIVRKAKAAASGLTADAIA